MNNLSDGARRLPLRHISIRVPWNDTSWEGVTCRKPDENISCLILPRIRENRNDEQEIALANESWKDLKPDLLPPCVSERGQFMAPFEIEAPNVELLTFKDDVTTGLLATDSGSILCNNDEKSSAA